MVYLSISLIILVFVIFSLDGASKNRRAKRLERIRTTWGVVKKDDLNFNRIGRYAALSKHQKPHTLSQQTLDDVDFQQMFAFIDRTTSRVGQQFLFRQVLHPFNTVADLVQINLFAHAMAANSPLREEVQKDLIKLEHYGAFNICNLIDLKVAERPVWFKYLYVNLILMFALVVLAFKFPVCLILLVIPVTINILVHYWNKGKISSTFNSFPELSTLMDVARNVLKKPVFQNSKAQASLHNLEVFQRKLFLLNPERATMQDELNQFGYYLSELLKGIFLIEVFSAYSLEKEVEKNSESISVLFDFVGAVDTSISIASLRAGCPETCEPRFVETAKEMYAEDLYHPLIKNCVKNDISVSNKSVLITGSNMSGKTTFLRTIVINSILAQSIYTCFARQFTTPFVKQFSSIRIDDDLFRGRSYFFEEVNVIGLFIEEMQSGYQNLFILDEVFKGTNSVERAALAKAILSYLNRGTNIVMVATHDLELSDMLKEEYDVYHFSETIDNGQLHFDHMLKPGPLKTRNAITLLELGNFPVEIIQEARALSTDLPA